MVYLKTKEVKGTPYYYLVHSFREGNKHKKKDQYIGRKKPCSEDLEVLKRKFLAELSSKNWLCLSKEDFNRIENIKEYARRQLDEEQLLDFCINFTYNTNAIENSSLSKEETINLIKKDIPTDKSFKDEIESFSHKRVFMKMINDPKPLSVSLIKSWHKNIFAHSKPEAAGRYRLKNVRVAEFKAPHFMDLSFLLEEFVEWYDENKKKLHPVELAALTHLKFVKIHPFLDGNGRIARLLINYVLHRHGYPMMTVEYKNRMAYYTALDKFDATQEEEVFVDFLIGSYLGEYSLIT